MNYTPEQIKNCFDLSRMISLIDDFAAYGGNPDDGVTRLAFSREDMEARQEFMRIIEQDLGLKGRIDTLGNIFARREGKHPDWPVILTGSHLDSVRNGGKYDGPAGVISALEAFRALDQLEVETEHPFELCVLSSEEPNTFGISTFGSRGLIGALDKAQLSRLTDETGAGFAEALANIGGDLNRIEEAIRQPDGIKYFVELHIEQMPNLDREKKQIGVVQGITGIYRESIEVQGVASHCGTTPMSKRQDALCAASELILAVETAARAENDLAVATVGHLTVYPNSINITPEHVSLTAEIRSFYRESLARIKAGLDQAILQLGKRRGIKMQRTVTYDNPPTRFSPSVTGAIQQAANCLGMSSQNLISMAGHDAAHLNRITQAGMIFIPCRNGLSHCPQEYTEAENIVNGAQCLLQTLLMLDARLEGA